jgi:hypothetical protein
MKKFKAFIEKVNTIEIRTINGSLDLSHYSESSDTAEDVELKRLQLLALTDMLCLDKAIILQHLNRLEQVRESFDKFWKIYEGKTGGFSNGTLDEALFIVQIKHLFIVPRYPNGQITLDFILNLHDAVTLKSAYLHGFLDQAKKTLARSNSKKTSNDPTTGQVALFFYYLIEGKVESPVKSEWEALLKKYKFKNSYLNVYLHYCRIGKGNDGKGKIPDPMNLKNLSIISCLLKKYPAAKKLAEKDYYQKDREFQE